MRTSSRVSQNTMGAGPRLLLQKLYSPFTRTVSEPFCPQMTYCRPVTARAMPIVAAMALAPEDDDRERIDGPDHETGRHGNPGCFPGVVVVETEVGEDGRA